MPKVDIWMPIYIGDYLGDTSELSATEHGAYLLLLMHYWMKRGEIGCDVDRLSRVCKSDTETARFILGYFFTLEDGNFKNKRADVEMKKAEYRRQSAIENGKRGGRPSKNNPIKTGGLTGGFQSGKPNENRAGNPEKSSSSSSSSSSSNEDINTSNISPKKKTETFIKPTYEEVRVYCYERHNGIDAHKFIDYYDSVGWMIGNKKMKDWKAAVRTWEHKNGGKVTPIPTAPARQETRCECGGTYNPGGFCRLCGKEIS